MTSELATLFDRDILRLQKEIEAFSNEQDLWRITGQIKNTAGNLCLHLIGNLKTYIGRNLGGIGHVRDRDAEFSTKDVSRQDLIRMVSETRTVVAETLNKLDASKLEEIYPEETLGYPMTTGFFLVHLVAHLSYHLGQINYLRRILA